MDMQRRYRDMADRLKPLAWDHLAANQQAMVDACLRAGEPYEAMLDLLSAMMEARASGRQDLALRSLDQAEQYLRMLGVQSVFYDAEHAALFDVLPARSGERTVRPALVRDGELVRRGVAAVAPMAKEE